MAHARHRRPPWWRRHPVVVVTVTVAALLAALAVLLVAPAEQITPPPMTLLVEPRAQQTDWPLADPRAHQMPPPPKPRPSRAVTRPPPKPTLSPIRTRAIAVARAQVGTPYRWGGDTPAEGFDCSGLTSYSYRKAGRVLPRTSRLQSQVGVRQRLSRLRPGDLVWWSAGHVAMWLGGFRIIESPRPGQRVQIRTLDFDSWWDREAVGIHVDVVALPRV